MRIGLVAVVLAAVLGAAGAASAGNVGYRVVSIPVPGDKPLAAGIWYPTAASEAISAIGLETQSVAPGAPVLGSGHPLVVFSHGTGSWFGQPFDTAHALAAAGFVVVAPSHTGDTYDDRSRALRVSERPAQLSRTLDYMLQAWPDRAAVDPRRIGAYGFSSGGFTVLAAIGGEPDLKDAVTRQCREHPHFYECMMRRLFGNGSPTPVLPVAHDDRIKAAVIAAPALGYAFGAAGLSKVTAPVQLWRAEWDTVLPQPYSAEAVRKALPKPPEYHVVPSADHFDFLPPCSPAQAKAAPEICVSNIDRAAFHQTFNAAVVRFFDKTLK